MLILVVLPHFDRARTGFYEVLLDGADMVRWCLVRVHDRALVLERVVQVAIAGCQVVALVSFVLFAVARRA